MAQPTVGTTSAVFAGTTDTMGNAITLATGLNAARCEVIWGAALDYPPYELAAYHAALYQLLEQGSPYGVARKNFSQFPSQPQDQSYWQLKAWGAVA